MLKDTDLPALPVVDSEGRLLGDITFDDVIDSLQEEATADALSQAGVGNLLCRDRVWSDRLWYWLLLHTKPQWVMAWMEWQQHQDAKLYLWLWRLHLVTSPIHCKGFK